MVHKEQSLLIACLAVALLATACSPTASQQMQSQENISNISESASYSSVGSVQDASDNGQSSSAPIPEVSNAAPGDILTPLGPVDTVDVPIPDIDLTAYDYEAVTSVVCGNKFYALPLAKEQYDFFSIIKNYSGITWTQNKITMEPDEIFEGTWSTPSFTYPVFKTLPNAAFTNEINKILEDIVCFATIHKEYEEGNPLYQMFEYELGISAGSAEVVFASAELVSIDVSFVGGAMHREVLTYSLNFNPTTGERCRLQNYINVTPDFVAQYVNRLNIPTNDLNAISDLVEKEGIDKATEIMELEVTDWPPGLEDSFWYPEEADIFFNYYKSYLEEVDNGSFVYYTWIEPDGLHLKTLYGTDPIINIIPFSDLEPYLYKNE